MNQKSTIALGSLLFFILEMAIIIYCFCHSILYGILTSILYFLMLASIANREIQKEMEDK